MQMHHVFLEFVVKQGVCVCVCVLVTQPSLLEMILKCFQEFISIAYDVCFNGPLNDDDLIIINLKIGNGFCNLRGCCSEEMTVGCQCVC